MISSREPEPLTVPSSAAVLCAGRVVFRRYTLQRLVGRGGMGVVWLARDEKLERLVALKFLPEVFFLDAAARDDLKRETRRSLDLTHPHIVRIHDFVEDEEAAAIAMEYVDGPTLSQLRVDQPSRCFEPAALASWTTALCGALDYAHESGRCVHRDLKPGNLMVSSRGVLKVTDFGISCGLHNTAARVSAWSSSGGTLGYMSPQQLVGELAAPSDDLYSIGATLYEMLTGKPPFYSGDLAVQIREVRPDSILERRRKFGLPSAPLPAEWEETIAACLAKRPEERPSSAGDIARRLGLTSGPAAETAPGLGENLQPTLRVAAARPVETPRQTPLRERLAPVAAQLVRWRWPILTACAVAAAIVPWISGVRPAKSSAPAEMTPVVNAAPVALAPAPSPIAGLPANAAPIVLNAAPAAAAPPPLAALTPDQRILLNSGDPPAPALSNAPTTALSTAPTTAPMTANAVAEAGPQVRLESVPAGVAFKVLASAYESPIAEVLFSGETPATLENLPPGSYRVVFTPAGQAPRAASVQVPTSGTAVFHQDFPHGKLLVRSQPAGAEIFCDDRPLGLAPLEVAVLPGAHEIEARREGRDARPRTVQIADAGEQTVNFDFRSTAATTRSTKTRRSKKPAEEDSVVTKVGRTLKTFFTGEKPKKR